MTHCTNGMLFNANLLAVLYHLKLPITRIAPKNVLFPASLLTYLHIILDLDRGLIRSKLISPLLNKPPRKLQLMHGSLTLAGYSAECRSTTRYFHWKTIKVGLYQCSRASTSNYARTVSHMNVQLAITKLLKPVPQNFPQCCEDLYKWLTSSGNMMLLLFSVKRSTQKHLKYYSRRTSFSDWLSRLALFIPSVPSLQLLARDSEMRALQMFWLKVVLWPQDLWLGLLKVVFTTALYVHIALLSL